MNFITSPEITTALALAGKLSFNPMTDTLPNSQGTPVKLEPPKLAPEVPEKDFDAGQSNYIAPPEDGSDVAVAVDPNSGRLQVLEPWTAWGGNDFLEAPVLMKVQGK